jgi:hypothetical protein
MLLPRRQPKRRLFAGAFGISTENERDAGLAFRVFEAVDSQVSFIARANTCGQSGEGRQQARPSGKLRLVLPHGLVGDQLAASARPDLRTGGGPSRRGSASQRLKGCQSPLK